MSEPEASVRGALFPASVRPFLTAKWRSGIIFAGLYWGVAKWQGTGFWSCLLYTSDAADEEAAGGAKDAVDAPFVGIYEPVSHGVEG